MFPKWELSPPHPLGSIQGHRRRDKGTVATVPLAGLETFPLREARRAALRSLQLLFPRPAVGKCEVLAGLQPGTPLKRFSGYRSLALG